MGIIHIMERGGEDYRAYKKAVKTAKEAVKEAKMAIDTICDLTDEMEAEYGYDERGYGERRGYRSRDWDAMDERRGRDSRGRYM